MAKSKDRDQTAPLGAVWSGSSLFAYAILLDTLVYEILGHLLYFISCELSAKQMIHMQCQAFFEKYRKKYLSCYLLLMWLALFSWLKDFCLCWGFMAQSTHWCHVEHGQFI